MDTGAFLVEEFINAVSAQLDRVQDALRLKAVNRPLTFALKDFSLDLQVFAEMDGDGNVRFRSAGPNEAGSSTLRLTFTTITRPMIEENTISLAATRSPALDELGLGPEERKRLEQLGVHNAFQLQRLGAETSGSTVARYSGVPIDRLRMALQMGRPSVSRITPIRPGGTPAGSRPSPAPFHPAEPPAGPAPFHPAQPGPVFPVEHTPGRLGQPAVNPGPFRPAQPVHPGQPVVNPGLFQPAQPVHPGRPITSPAAGRPGGPLLNRQVAGLDKRAAARRLEDAGEQPLSVQGSDFDGGITPGRGANDGYAQAQAADWEAPVGYGAGLDGGAGQASGTAAGNPAEVLAVRPGETHLHLAGANLVGPEGAPTVRLNGRALDVSQADDDQMVVALPPDHQGGQLDIELYDGQVASFYVVVMDDQAGEFADGPLAGPDEPADPWMRR